MRVQHLHLEGKKGSHIRGLTSETRELETKGRHISHICEMSYFKPDTKRCWLKVTDESVNFGFT